MVRSFSRSLHVYLVECLMSVISTVSMQSFLISLRSVVHRILSIVILQTVVSDPSFGTLCVCCTKSHHFVVRSYNSYWTELYRPDRVYSLLTTLQSDVNRTLESILNLNWQLVKTKKKKSPMNLIISTKLHLMKNTEHRTCASIKTF